MIPGSNLLAQALTVITPSECLLYSQTGRTLNSIGQWVSTYADPVAVLASVQAVPRSVYKMMGLDWQKSYVQFYSVDLIQDLARDRSGDMLEWNGRRYEIQSKNDWRPMDGWSGIVGVDVGEAVGALPLFPLSATEEDLILFGFDGRAVLSNDDYDFSWAIAEGTSLKAYGAALNNFTIDQPIEFPEGMTKCFELGISADMLEAREGSVTTQVYIYFSVATLTQFVNVSVQMLTDGTCSVGADDSQTLVSGLSSAPSSIGVQITNTGGTLSVVINIDGTPYAAASTDILPIPPIATALGSLLFGSGFTLADIGNNYAVAWRPYADMMTLIYPPGSVDMQEQLIA